MKGKTGGSLGSTTFKERTEEERPDGGDPAWRWVAPGSEWHGPQMVRKRDAK